MRAPKRPTRASSAARRRENARAFALLLRVTIEYGYLLVLLRVRGKRSIKATTPFDVSLSVVRREDRAGHPRRLEALRRAA